MKALYRTLQMPRRAQAIVEFAIVLPILMMLLVGILEVGRLIYIYAVVTNASRDGSRYGSAVGLDDSGLYNKFEYCQGIVDAASRFAYFVPLSITIEYDHGPASSTPYDICNIFPVDNVSVSASDRVKVTVSTDYSPLVKLIPISTRTIEASSARTIIGIVEMEQPPSGSGGPGGSGATDTPTPTATLDPSLPTDTPTPTSTSTSAGPGETPTPLKTEIPVGTYTPTDTPAPSVTPTSTDTPTPTPTPTLTPTAVSGCDSITASDIYMDPGSPVISMTITNPHDAVTVSSVYLLWNAATGGAGIDEKLTWTSTTLAETSWLVDNNSGSFTSTPPQLVMIPGNNTVSTIIITFDEPYENPIPNETTITINLSTPGCSAITKTQ